MQDEYRGEDEEVKQKIAAPLVELAAEIHHPDAYWGKK